MIRLKSILTEQQSEQIAIGGLILNNVNIETLSPAEIDFDGPGSSIKITFNKDNIPSDSQLTQLNNFPWNCAIVLTLQGNIIDGHTVDGTIKCSVGSTGANFGDRNIKKSIISIENVIKTIVDRFPKPADTDNFSQNILTALGL